MSTQLIPEVANYLFYAFVVFVVCAGVVAAVVRYAGSLRDLIQG